MSKAEEMLVLQHRHTDQTLLVPLQKYRKYSADRYRNWKLKGQGAFIAPPRVGPGSAEEISWPIRSEGLS